MSEPQIPEEASREAPRVKEYPQENTVTATGLGRLVQLAEPEFGMTVLVDVTDRPDPSSIDPADGPQVGRLVRGLMQRELTDEQFNNTWHLDNGIVRVITDKYGEKGNPRVYVSAAFTDPEDPKVREITTHILQAAGYESGTQLGGYIPFSAKLETSSPQETLYKEVERGLSEVERAQDPQSKEFQQQIGRFIETIIPTEDEMF